jgi:hypothetical protein
MTGIEGYPEMYTYVNLEGIAVLLTDSDAQTRCCRDGSLVPLRHGAITE